MNPAEQGLNFTRGKQETRQKPRLNDPGASMDRRVELDVSPDERDESMSELLSSFYGTLRINPQANGLHLF